MASLIPSIDKSFYSGTWELKLFIILREFQDIFDLLHSGSSFTNLWHFPLTLQHIYPQSKTQDSSTYLQSSFSVQLLFIWCCCSVPQLSLCDFMDSSVLHHPPPPTPASLLKFMSIESMMPSSHLILWHPLLLLPSILPSIRVFSHKLAVYIRYCSFSCSSTLNQITSFFCKEIQPVHSEGDFFGRNDAKAETPVLWPPHAKSWLIGKDSDAGRDSGQEEKGTTEDEIAGWHHWLDGRESQWTPGVGDGQGGLACCDSWGRKESDTTERLIWSDLIWAPWCPKGNQALFDFSHPALQPGNYL